MQSLERVLLESAFDDIDGIAMDTSFDTQLDVLTDCFDECDNNEYTDGGMI